MFGLKRLIRRENDAAPRRILAEVTAKRTLTTRPYCRTCAVSKSELSTAYYVTFRQENGEELELIVSADHFASMTEGERGTLCVARSQFLGFESVC